MKKAAQLHDRYEFEQALSIYKKVLDNTVDSLERTAIEKKIVQSENGLSLLDFVFEPVVAATGVYKKDQFYLHYPISSENQWVKLPQQLAPEGDLSSGDFPVMLTSQGARKIIFSAPDNTGAWNIYSSHLLNDTLWSVPVLLNENITSAGNEIFPIVSSNGKTLYFSSNGHYGVGGYDLYVCQWDEELNDWGVPQNLGFPYSSPKDDFFFYNTLDGLYSIFASNRTNESDSATVYVLNYENVPLKKSVTPAEALVIAKLKKSGPDSNEQTQESGDNANIADPASENEYSKYNLAVNNVRKLQQELADSYKLQASNRELYNTLKNPDDLIALEKKIAELEITTMSLQNDVNTAVAELQKLEMEFLSKGMFIPTVEVEQKAKPAVADEVEKQPFVFAQNKLGKAPSMIVEVPEPEIDLSFRIADEAVVVDIADFPQGLVYQIQLFTVSKKASLKSLKGLAPVFERKYPSGKYIYSVGTFRTYNDAMSNLNKVRKRGFSSAMITAFKDGKSLSVKEAKAKLD
ncbi:MAG: PD40 domain-containing protein, partial [Bacteroidales bacterium]|nr:PD40 domain-containing protein [Bacteroidales bacterium]